MNTGGLPSPDGSNRQVLSQDHHRNLAARICHLLVFGSENPEPSLRL
jgi:hypothetical protein